MVGIYRKAIFLVLFLLFLTTPVYADVVATRVEGVIDPVIAGHIVEVIDYAQKEEASLKLPKFKFKRKIFTCSD